MRQPPENSEQGRAWSAAEKPSPARISAARAGAECAPMSASRVWISAMRCGSCAVSASASKLDAFLVGAQHDVDQAVGTVGRLLRQAADASARREPDLAVLGGDLARDRAEQGRLAGAIAPDQPDARAGRDVRGGLVDQQAAGDADRQFVDDEHGPLCGRRAAREASCRVLAMKGSPNYLCRETTEAYARWPMPIGKGFDSTGDPSQPGPALSSQRRAVRMFALHWHPR